MKIGIAFICIGNSCRSQIAEGFTRHSGAGIFEVFSAGTHPASIIYPDAIEVMKEKDIDISMQYPKTLSSIPKVLDVLITMGCSVECPYIPAGYREDWGIGDPVGLPLKEFRKVRDIIEGKVIELVELAKDSESKEIFLDKLNKR